jgi:hypothetical protein
MTLSDFINAYERNKARPHPKRYRKPVGERAGAVHGLGDRALNLPLVGWLALYRSRLELPFVD